MPSRQNKKKCSFGNINNHSKIPINKLCLQVKPWCDNLSAFEPRQKKFKKKTVVTRRRQRRQRLALAVFAASSDGCLRWSPAETDIWSWATWQRGSRYRGGGGSRLDHRPQTEGVCVRTSPGLSEANWCSDL